MKRAAVALLLAVSVTIPASAEAADRVRSCAGNAPFGDGSSGMWYGDLSVRNLSCQSGRRLVRRAYFDGRMHVPRWSCRHIGNYSDGGIYRCTHAHRAIRFSAGG